MRDYIMRESKEFLPGLEIQIQEMEARLKISMCIEHKGNWQDSGRRWARRTAVRFFFLFVLYSYTNSALGEMYTKKSLLSFSPALSHSLTHSL